MKNIYLATLLIFHGLTMEYLDTFMFYFEVVHRTYDYVLDAQKLNILSLV